MTTNNFVGGCGCMCHIPGYVMPYACCPCRISNMATITSSSIDQKRLDDIESRLHELEGKIEHLYQGVMKCHERIDGLHEHKNMQIDENRKISRRVDELQNKIDDNQNYFYSNVIEEIDERIKNIELSTVKKPHECPVCNGFASMFVNKNTAEGPRLYHQEKNPCHACKGTGIIWS